MLVIHLRSQDDHTLERRTYIEQKENSLPGLAQETKEICEKLNIEDCNETSQNKQSFRKSLLLACHAKNEERIMQGASEVKCSRLFNENYGRKPYFQNQTIVQSRKWFKT